MMSQYEIRQRQALEEKVARQIVEDAIKAGYSLNVNNGGDTNELPEPVIEAQTVLDAMFKTDEEHLLLYKDGARKGWVFFVYGNDGWDIVNDYTTNLEPIMVRANRTADQYS